MLSMNEKKKNIINNYHDKHKAIAIRKSCSSKDKLKQLNLMDYTKL